MKIRFLIICLAGIFISVTALAIAEETIPTVFHFDGAVDGGASEKIHPSIYTGPFVFQHRKHFEEYGMGCGACHHDGDHEPITGYADDKPFACGDCHDEEGLTRGPIAENAASHDDLISRRVNVLHIRCIGCHKKINSERHAIRMPEACRMCHTKRPQDWTLE
jgi:hypothetical protein